jgi:hypothetical protein
LKSSKTHDNDTSSSKSGASFSKLQKRARSSRNTVDCYLYNLWKKGFVESKNEESNCALTDCGEFIKKKLWMIVSFSLGASLTILLIFGPEINAAYNEGPMAFWLIAISISLISLYKSLTKSKVLLIIEDSKKGESRIVGKQPRKK